MGRKSVDEFREKARSCLDLSTILFNQVGKHARPGSVISYVQLVNTNIDALLKDWDRRERYFERGEIARLREAFRRFGFMFYRFGNYPEAESFLSVGQNLRRLGEKLRNLSSVQTYFIYGLGTNPMVPYPMTPTLTVITYPAQSTLTRTYLVLASTLDWLSQHRQASFAFRHAPMFC